MQQNFQDSLAVCKEYGHPDLFITFTCNPKWVEILDAVNYAGSQDASVRPNIVARVFKMKLDAMIADFTQDSVLGRVLAGMVLINCLSPISKFMVSLYNIVLLRCEIGDVANYT